LKTRLGGRPRNRWQDEVKGRIFGEGWKEKVYKKKSNGRSS
jgi:hypothetical protein